MDEYCVIYGLTDPRTGQVRYVGKTSRYRLTKRLWEHLRSSKVGRTKKNCWLRKIATLGLKPGIKVLQEVLTQEWQYWEKYWIRKLGVSGKLTNLTEGGDTGSLSNVRAVARLDPVTGELVRYVSIAEAARKNGLKSESRIFDSCSGKTCYSKGYLWRYLDESGSILKVDHKVRAVAQVDYKTLKIVRKFRTCYEVREAGFDFVAVHKVCNGKNRSSNGYIWRYLNSRDEIVEPLPQYKMKMVNRLNSAGEFIERYENAQQAAETLSVRSSDLILRACRNSHRTAYGYKWEFHKF